MWETIDKTRFFFVKLTFVEVCNVIIERLNFYKALTKLFDVKISNVGANNVKRI